MGMIRKTMSIGTLGLVSFRSKSERLERAEAALGEADMARLAEAAARIDAEARADAVTHELKANKRRKRKVEAKSLLQTTSDAIEEVGHAVAATAKAAEPAVRSGTETAQTRAHEAAVAGKRLHRRARREAKNARARATVTQATATVQAHQLGGAVKDQIDDAKDAISEALHR